MTVMLSRRVFIRASLSAAGGLMIAAIAPEFAGATTISGEPWSPENGSSPDEVNAFVVIDPDNAITLRVAKSEMGQGVLTSMAMIVAEELECDFAKVKVEYASAHRNLIDGKAYGQMGTGGSSSVRRSRVFLQQAGASARARLIAAAAAKWGVEPAACVASAGLVRHEASGRSASFGELAPGAANVALTAEPAIKTPDEFKLIGQGIRRIDTALKATGAARFGIDTRLPGMAYAAVANCPVFGGKLKSYDFSAVSGRRGIIAAVPVTNGVAVVADNFWRAKEALAEMPIEWDFGPAASTDSAEFAAEYRAALDGPLADGGGHGDVAAAFAEAGEGGRGGVRGSLSRACADGAAQRDRPLAARPDRRVDGHARPRFRASARGRGRRSRSKGGRRPQLLPGRRVRPAGGQRRIDPGGRGLQSAQSADQADLDPRRRHPLGPLPAAGGVADARRARRRTARPPASTFTTAVGSITRSLGWGKVENGVERQAVEGLSNCPYRADALKVGVNLKNTHVPVMFWRSVGSSQNAFAVESFIDEVAHAAGRDPLEYRRGLLEGRPDFLAVLDALALKGDWGKPLRKGVGRGVAIHEAFGTIVGEIAEVAVSDRGEVKVERVVACVDCGHLVNPLTAAMQIESAVLYGLTAALFGEITIRQGRVEQGNFDTYPIARMADAPVIETHFVLSGGDKWGGFGEPGTPPIAPAVANAIFAVTGKRIRSLPLKNAALGV